MTVEIDEFSSGYYVLEMRVVPYDDGPTISQGIADIIDTNLYAQTTAPALFKVDLDGSRYFTPEGERSIPQDYLGIPTEWFDEDDLSKEYKSRSVYLAKPKYAYLFQQSEKIGEGVYDFNDVDIQDIEDVENLDIGDGNG